MSLPVVNFVVHPAGSFDKLRLNSNAPEVYPPKEGAQAMPEADKSAAYGFGIKELVPVKRIFKCQFTSRGRDTGHLAPPAQIPACTTNALGSYLGCVTQRR